MRKFEHGMIREPQLSSSCAMAHHSDLLDEMKKFSGDLPNHKQIEVLKKLAEETKAHLRRFVAMRGN